MINIMVAMFLPSIFCSYIRADLDRNGMVDFHDFAIFGIQWLKESGWGVTPLFEFNSDSEVLVVKRGSVAVQEKVGNFYDVAANQVRTKSVCAVSAVTLSEYFNYNPLTTDSSRGLVLCTESIEGYHTAQRLYRTSDGVTFTEIVNIITDSPFRAYYEIMHKEFPCGVWSA